MTPKKKMVRVLFWIALMSSYWSDFYCDFASDFSGSLLYMVGAVAGIYLFVTEEKFFYNCVERFMKGGKSEGES